MGDDKLHLRFHLSPELCTEPAASRTFLNTEQSNTTNNQEMTKKVPISSGSNTFSAHIEHSHPTLVAEIGLVGMEHILPRELKPELEDIALPLRHRYYIC